MEIGYCRLGIRKICHRLPRSFRNVISHPIDEILNLAPLDPGVENGPDLELGQAVHVERRRNGFDATRESIGHMWLQEADVEDRMDMHGRWET